MNYGKSILKRFGTIANIDLSNYVQKVTGKSLIANSEIQRLANVTSGTLTPEQLAAIAAQVPVPPASAITQDTTHRFTTDTEKITWGAKINNTDPRLTDARQPTSHSHFNDHVPGSDDQDLSDYVLTNDSRLTDNRTPVTHSHAASDITGTVVLTNDLRLTNAREPLPHGHTLPPEAVLTDDPRLWDARTPLTHSHSYEPANANIQTHVGSSHAPATAQKNSDITKAEIEAKLTGVISTHSHSGGSDPFIKLIVAGDKPTGANVTPVTLGISFNYVANKTYVIDLFMLVAPTAATTGCGFMIDTDSAVTYVGSFNIHQLAVAGTVSGGSSIGDLGVTSQGYSSGMVGTGSNFVAGSGILITGANPGVATFYFRSETTAVTTCKSGSCVRVMLMN